MSANDEYVPLGELYREKYILDEEEARIRAEGTSIDTSPESLARSAEAGKALAPGAPVTPQARPPLESSSEAVRNLQSSPLRDAVNKALGTMTGGVLSLDAIDKHLESESQGVESPLAQKLKSPELLKVLDPVGNTAEALARETMKREGTPQEVIDKAAPLIGLVAGALLPTGGPKKAKVGTEILMNSMFSGPATHVGNITANGLVSAWAVPERFLSATASALEYGVTLGKHERTVFFGEAGAMLFGYTTATVDALRESLRAFKTGESRLGASILEDVGGAAARPTYRYGPEGLRKVEVADSVVGQSIGFWGTVWRSPTRALGAEDALFKTFNYQAELYAQIYREAARTGDLSLENMKRLLANPDPAFVTRAEQFAVTHTFQRSLNELGFVGRVGGGVAQQVSNVDVAGVPLGRLIVPVVRTPANIADFTMARTPILGMIQKKFITDVAAGGALRAEALGRNAGGSALIASLVYFGAGDILTGGGPTDPILLENKKQLTGWQPYSIRIGDTYYSFDRLAPVGAMLGIAADFSEIAGQLPEWKAAELGEAFRISVSRNLASRTFLESAADFFDAVAGDPAAKEKIARGVARSAVPGIVRTAKNITDPTKRETIPGANPDADPTTPEKDEFGEVRRLVNEARASIPGVSTLLPPRRNLWGDPIEVPKGWPLDWVSPVFKSVRKHDPAGDEIVRLGHKGLLTVDRMPRVILGADPTTHPIDQPPSPMDVGVELTDGEYDRFVRLVGNELKIDGKGMHERLNELVTSDADFKAASDAARGVIITKVVGGYKRAAVGELLKPNADGTPSALATAYEARMRGKADALTAPATAPGVTTPSQAPSPAPAPRPAPSGRVVPGIR